MKIERKNLTDGACNLCNKGRLNDTCDGLVYPYTHVTHIKPDASGASLRVCDDCLDEIKKI